MLFDPLLNLGLSGGDHIINIINADGIADIALSQVLDDRLVHTSVAHRLNRICDHVFHIEIHVCQIEILCDHQALVLNGYRIVYRGAVRPGRVRRVADLHTRDGFGNLSHALDHRNFKVKT